MLNNVIVDTSQGVHRWVHEAFRECKLQRRSHDHSLISVHWCLISISLHTLFFIDWSWLNKGLFTNPTALQNCCVHWTLLVSWSNSVVALTDKRVWEKKRCFLHYKRPKRSTCPMASIQWLNSSVRSMFILDNSLSETLTMRIFYLAWPTVAHHPLAWIVFDLTGRFRDKNNC